MARMPLSAEQRQALAPFVAAAEGTLRDWAGLETARLESFAGTAADLDQGAARATLELRRAAPGTLAVTLSAAVAARLAENVLADAGLPAGAVAAADWAGELLNLIAGHAKALLHGAPEHFLLGTPRIGAAPAIGPWAVAVLSGPWGELRLGIRDAAAP